ncbi:hypothetical protein [Streptomyces sp. NRRL S-1448]|uniref:hypothetical protein n=1 Tax=Streptomyces sp. NRRL S-1448 TaxID=1463883 RepID=UPI0004C28321|nr:hypothetical protein [Streptomyces sp. NRRL S-1448]
MTAGSLPAVTVLIDKDDHPAWTAAAHAAHDPAIGRLAVDPSPANGAPAALAHDLLYALGKRLPHGGETCGSWADSQQPAWDAVATWILTHHIGHLIVCRTDRLTHARQQQLLTLRERCGIHLTLLRHRPATPALNALLEQTPHHVVDTLPHARAVMDRAEHSPDGTRSAGQQRPAGSAFSLDNAPWITSPAWSDGMVTDRPKRAGCPGAPELTSTKNGAPPTRGHDRKPADVLAARLNTVAHPLHATALTIHAITGTDIARLALVRGIDINETATAVKVHDSTAHRRCRLYPLPTWARCLVRAAGIHGQLKDRAPDGPLFPLITARYGEQLRLTATGIRYTLGHHRQKATPRPPSQLSAPALPSQP